MDHINNTILITGGTGSFGNAMCRRLLKTDIKEIRIFSRDEKKQDDMRRAYGDKRLSFYIGDVAALGKLLMQINKMKKIRGIKPCAR